MKIKLRKRISESTGKTYLSIEYYLGYYKDANGKIKHNRKFETLPYFLITHPVSDADFTHNKAHSELAKYEIAKRLMASKSNPDIGSESVRNFKKNFIDYFEEQIKKREDSGKNYAIWVGALKHFKEYAGVKVLFGDLTKDLIQGFKVYLKEKATSKNEKLLSVNTQNSYFLRLKAILDDAVKDEIISRNPSIGVKPVKVEEVKKEFLSVEELRRLAHTDCKSPILKRAFLFSCLTGIKWTQICRLRWSDVSVVDGQYGLNLESADETKIHRLPIAPAALVYLGQPSMPDNLVFEGLKYSTWCNIVFQKWCKAANITKKISFHSARYTCAMLHLALGSDLASVSQLMGNKSTSESSGIDESSLEKN